jgi:hypothetical protein
VCVHIGLLVVGWMDSWRDIDTDIDIKHSKVIFKISNRSSLFASTHSDIIYKLDFSNI